MLCAFLGVCLQNSTLKFSEYSIKYKEKAMSKKMGKITGSFMVNLSINETFAYS